MAVKMKLKDALALYSTIAKMEEISLDIKVAYKLALLKEPLEKHYNFYNDQWKRVMNEYALKDDEGNIALNESKEFTVPKEKAKDFEKASNELAELEVELPAPAIELDSLADSGLGISDLYNLRHIIKE